MNTPNTYIDKRLYKAFILYVKYMPITTFVLMLIGIILNVLNISSFITMCLGGTSFLNITLLYLISKVFKFCHLYRLPLHGVVISDILIILNKVGLISSGLLTVRLLLLVFGVFIVIYVVGLYKNRNNPKIDYIKNFCETYCKQCNGES